MKKILRLLLPILLVPSISACQDKEHSIIAIKTFDDSFNFVELNIDQLYNLIDSKQEFILELYTSYCSHCKDLEPKLVQFSQKENNVIYRLSLDFIVSQEDYDNRLVNKYPTIFVDEGTPQILFINNSELTYAVNSSKSNIKWNNS